MEQQLTAHDKIKLLGLAVANNPKEYEKVYRDFVKLVKEDGWVDPIAPTFYVDTAYENAKKLSAKIKKDMENRTPLTAKTFSDKFTEINQSVKSMQ